MSTKASTSKKTDLKLGPTDAIITRNKSSQMKRKLRNTDKSMKKINQMTQQLQSPTSKSTQSRSPKGVVQKTIDNSARKVQTTRTISTKEFYPNKSKRNIPVKKVVLKPKHELKVICSGASKRKLCVPQRGSNSPLPKRPKVGQIPSASPKSSKPTKAKLKSRISSEHMDDSVKSEDTESLNDEDWLEILTCESPVWWEDPLDDNFIEEAIRARASFMEQETQNLPLEEAKLPPSKIELSNPSELALKTKTPTKHADAKFNKKRTKLENVLGFIKNNKNKLDIPQTSNKLDSSMSISDTKVSKLTLDKKERNTDCQLDSHQSDKEIIRIDVGINKSGRETKSDLSITDKEITKRDAEINERINAVTKIKKGKKVSESTEEEDLFYTLRDEDILRDLENIDIPIEPGEYKNDDCVIVDDVTHTEDTLEILDKLPLDSEKEAIEDHNSNEKKATTEINSSLHTKKTDTTFLITSIQNDITSPVSVRSLMSEENYESSCVSHDINSISDTNITFIYEDEITVNTGIAIESYVEDIDVKTEKSDSIEVKDEVVSINKPFCLENFKESSTASDRVKSKINFKLNGINIKGKECMTVYKIISNNQDTKCDVAKSDSAEIVNNSINQVKNESQCDLGNEVVNIVVNDNLDTNN